MPTSKSEKKNRFIVENFYTEPKSWPCAACENHPNKDFLLCKLTTECFVYFSSSSQCSSMSVPARRSSTVAARGHGKLVLQLPGAKYLIFVDYRTVLLYYCTTVLFADLPSYIKTTFFINRLADLKRELGAHKSELIHGIPGNVRHRNESNHTPCRSRCSEH